MCEDRCGVADYAFGTYTESCMDRIDNWLNDLKFHESLSVRQQVSCYVSLAAELMHYLDDNEETTLVEKIIEINSRLILKIGCSTRYRTEEQHKEALKLLQEEIEYVIQDELHDKNQECSCCSCGGYTELAELEEILDSTLSNDKTLQNLLNKPSKDSSYKRRSILSDL